MQQSGCAGGRQAGEDRCDGALGYGVGEAVSFATNRKRAPSLAAIAAIFAGLAGLAAGLVSLPPLLAIAAGVIAAVVAWGRMR